MISKNQQNRQESQRIGDILRDKESPQQKEFVPGTPILKVDAQRLDELYLIGFLKAPGVRLTHIALYQPELPLKDVGSRESLNLKREVYRPHSHSVLQISDFCNISVLQPMDYRPCASKYAPFHEKGGGVLVTFL